MEDKTRKYKIKETFDSAADGYDKPALRFFTRAAEHLVDSMKLKGNEHILDVACGTGAVALACVRHLPDGRVTGVDLSEGMLKKARDKATAKGFRNVEFRCADLENMGFEKDTFDGACCGFGMFFLPDMEAAFKTIAQHVKPGGKIAISSFTGEVMEPFSQQFIDRIQGYGIEIPPLSWRRLDEAEKHHALYHAAGIRQIDSHTVQAGYHLSGFDEWWDILWHSGFRGLLSQLTEDELDRFKQEHRTEVEQHATADGLWLDVEVLISVGSKPK